MRQLATLEVATEFEPKRSGPTRDRSRIKIVHSRALGR